MTREQYQTLLGLLNQEIAIFAECVARGNSVTRPMHQKTLTLLSDAKRELNKLYFSNEPNGVITNATSSQPEQTAAQAA